MKEEIRYIAVDGTKFESKELCEEYERNLHCLFMHFMSNVQFYDNEDNQMLPIPNLDTWNNDMYYDELEHIYNTCAYIYIKNNLSPEVIKYNEEYYGFMIPTKQGKYCDNDMTNEWERMEA